MEQRIQIAHLQQGELFFFAGYVLKLVIYIEPMFNSLFDLFGSDIKYEAA